MTCATFGGSLHHQPTHMEHSRIAQSVTKILRRHEVEQRTGLSRSSIYAMINEGTFPRPIQLSSRSVGWPAIEVEDWIQRRIATRNETHPGL